MSSSRVIVAAAELVCSVDSTRWPVSAACTAICAVSQVADLADHDDVRILPQDRAQHAGERQADLRLHLDLVDAGQLVLDRVLDGEDLARDRVQLEQPV